MLLRLSAVLVFLALLGILPAAAQDSPAPNCPCSSYDPSPCAVTALVSLPDQGERLGLTVAQVGQMRSLQDRHLNEVHELLGEIQALRQAVHTLDRPFEVAEVFALFDDLSHHEAELGEAFRTAEGSLLGVLDDGQRVRWDRLIVEAADLQGAVVGCGTDATL